MEKAECGEKGGGWDDVIWIYYCKTEYITAKNGNILWYNQIFALKQIRTWLMLFWYLGTSKEVLKSPLCAFQRHHRYVSLDMTVLFSTISSLEKCSWS